MTPALERLSELVRQAEAKTRARKVVGDVQHAAEQFRIAELRARRAVEKQRAVRPVASRALEQADSDEQMLKDLVRKLAVYKSSLGSEADAERLVAASQAEIERTRRQSRIDLEEVARELEEARRELRIATDHFRTLRRELDRLQPELSAQFAGEDQLLWDAESHFPGGQLQLLAHEVEAGMTAFASLGKHEQYARLKVWIGRFRFYQASQDREVTQSEEIQNLAHQVFHRLKWLSKEYEPGYIEAFRQDYSTDWAAYVTDSQEQLVQAIEAVRRAREGSIPSVRDRERTSSHEQAVLASGAVTARTTGVPTAPASSVAGSPAPASNCVLPSSLGDLKSLLTRIDLPQAGLDEFLIAVKYAVNDVGVDHPELLRLVWPYREYITGEDGLASLQRQVEQLLTQPDSDRLQQDR
jgi:hypothetical protein